MQRNLTVDILKLAMAFLVVALHGNMLSETSALAHYLLHNGIARLGVPVFLLISGFYFYNVKEPVRARAFIEKLCILYVVWFALYAVLWYNDPPISIVKEFVVGWYHLWYLSHSAAAFALLWLLRGRPKTLFALSVVFALCGLTIQYGAAYGLWPEKLYTWRNALLFCFPFIYIGYSINRCRAHKRKPNLPLLLVPGFCLLMLEAFLNYRFSGAAFDILASLYFVAPLLLVVAQRGKVRSGGKTLAQCSTVVYLVHALFLIVGQKFLGLPPTLNVFFAFAASLLAAWPLILLNTKFKYLL
jgi:surface polysaccharide O-acyltransferase-like enzyme